MGEKSKIAWCDHTFNPWIGCTKVSPGCANCYAEVGPAAKLKGIKWGPGQLRHRTGESNWNLPLRWNRKAAESGVRAKVFCASLADWLDPEVPIEWLADLLVLIAETPHLDWLLLTKRPEKWRERMGAIAADEWGLPLGAAIVAQQWLAGTPPANIWLGTTVEDERRADERIPALLTIPARLRFLSCEPLLEAINVGDWLAADSRGFATIPGYTGFYFFEGRPDWVIVGGESGHHARWFNVDWARGIVQQCKAAGVAVFVKQLGAMPFLEPPVSWLVEEGSDYKNRYLIDDEGRAWPRLDDKAGADPAEWPEDLRVQQWPEVPHV